MSMFAKLTKVALLATVTASLAFAGHGATLYGAKGDKEKTFMKVLEDMEAKGYILSDPHERINDSYKTKYGGTKLDNLGFFSTTKDKAVRELLMKHPKLGGFSPFNFHVYKVTGEDTTWYGHLDPNTMLDIAGVTDAADRKTFVDSFKDLDALAKDMMKPTKTKEIEYKTLPKKPMMEFEIPVVIGEDEELSDFVDSFQEAWEGAFEKHGYIVAGYKNFHEAYTDEELEFGKYDAYWVYSLCHFPFSNGIFNERPDAGIFAPCSVYMYIEKGGKTLHVGMPYLENWVAVNGIKDAKKVQSIRDLDKDIEKIYKTELNAK